MNGLSKCFWFKLVLATIVARIGKTKLIATFVSFVPKIDQLSSWLALVGCMVIKRMYVRIYSYLRQSQFKNNFTVTQSILHTISLTQLFREYFYKKKTVGDFSKKKIACLYDPGSIPAGF
jgi:hypothetical protein